MTTNRMTLIQAVPHVGDEDLLRQLAETALAKLMAFEVEDVVGAAKGQQAPTARVTYRNGYRERPLHTRLGTLELRIPKLRQGTYFPSFLEPRRLSERALTAVIQEAWVGGMSPCKVDDLVPALGMTGISKSQVSALCGALDERVNARILRIDNLVLDMTALRRETKLQRTQLSCVAWVLAEAAGSSRKPWPI